MPERPRVLATDDRPDVLRVVDRTLRGRYECDFAANVAEAREKLTAEEFDLALCDIEMPGESGLVLVEELVAAHRQTAIVVVSGIDDPETATRAFELGAHGYLVKPFSSGQLLIAAMTALRRRQLEIALEKHGEVLEQRLQTLVERAPVPIYVKDRQRRYLVVNRVAQELSNVPMEKLIGSRDEEWFDPELAARSRDGDRRVLAGEPFEDDFVVQVGHGKERALHVAKFPYVGDDGEIAGVFGIAAETTHHREATKLHEELAAAQRRAIEELRASRQETVERLVLAIEMHDAETGAHVERMARTAALLGERLGLAADRVELLRVAAPMHDVGKIATPDGILRKPGALDPDERAEMERHTIVGYEILSGSDSDLLQMASRIALSHHERFDGDGYPQGLAGDRIPLEARIVAVADVFDALLSDRPYRPAMSVEQALGVICDGRGTHFDPAVVDALLAVLDAALATREGSGGNEELGRQLGE